MDNHTELSAQAEPLELRVLHGPQAGSTLPIEHGTTYTLGSADSCAVLLAGTQIEGEHVGLTVDGDGIAVTTMDGKVTTIDRDEVHDGQVMPLGTVLRLGRVKLTVDSVDAPWPQEEALEEPDPVVAPQTDPEQEAQEEVEQEASDAVNTSLASRPAVSRPRSLAPVLMLGVAAALLVGAAVTAWVSSEAGPVTAQEEVTTPITRPIALAPASASASAPTAAPTLDVAALTREFPQATLTAARGADGRWVLSGRIPSEEARARLRQVASALPTAPDVRVMLDGERIAAVAQFLQKHRVVGEMELNVNASDTGALRIGGAAATREGLAAVVDAARKELADAAPMNFAVVLRPELPGRFEERLRNAGLASKFKVLSRDPKLELQAVLTGNEVRVWEKLFEEFVRDYGNVLTIVAQVKHDREIVEVHIETVVAGAFPYVVTTSGKRISPGGVLEGRTLVAIRDGELVFSDGMRVRYGN
ncbi:type III secretion system inner membrane ring subunit SctD [Caenimonas sp. SL110]|uniref:type III secretion system inner membrane ring subunit SctD n=1 Tax=Caenimonas sp. SL110 TaxID=1450524 RepID=UPI00128B8B47|nr:type III secretion system inner membrane ring subunit SctD [Caenimonas sp. SL110]